MADQQGALQKDFSRQDPDEMTGADAIARSKRPMSSLCSAMPVGAQMC
jgi:hypothetical protein